MDTERRSPPRFDCCLSGGSDLALGNCATREPERALHVAGVDSRVAVNANCECAVEILCLGLEISSARLHLVDQRECEGLRHVSIQITKDPSEFVTHVDYALDLPEHRSDWLTNDWDRVEQSSLSDQNVQESLVNTNELQESATFRSFSTSCSPRGMHRRWHRSAVPPAPWPCRPSAQEQW